MNSLRPFCPNLMRHYGSSIGYILLCLLAIGPACCTQAGINIPRQKEWTDNGIALSAGSHGSWDFRLYGMISPCTVVKKKGTYFLYYIGADGDRSSDGGPRHRALGVATSTDGIRFTKYNGNPILTHLPQNNEEEGIFSAAATLDDNNNIVLYYSALDAGTSLSTLVNSDVRLAISANGVDFTDLGNVLSHKDGSVWGYGDELFPVGVFVADNTWYLYYIAKGHEARWDLGLAWGSSPKRLANSKGVLKGEDKIMGGCDPVRLDDSKIWLLLIRGSTKSYMEVRTVSTDAPEVLHSTEVVYDFVGYTHSTIFLDKEANTYFMYVGQTDGNQIRVFTAPMNRSGDIPLSANNVTVENNNEELQDGFESKALPYSD